MDRICLGDNEQDMDVIEVVRIKDTVKVLLLPYKDGSGWTFVNLTKSHICLCKFGSRGAAIRDLETPYDVIGYRIRGRLYLRSLSTGRFNLTKERGD